MIVEDLPQKPREEFFFMQAVAPSPFHWHFQQALEALQQELFLPGVSGLLNGIEASIRTTICEIEGRCLQGDLGKTMSNGLLRVAQDKGIDVGLLAFPNETDFAAKLVSKSRNDQVQIVRIRNDICHGNFQGYVRRDPEIGEFFTPECLGPLSAQLLAISFVWAKELAAFLHKAGRRSKSATDLIVPKNPLSRYLEA